MAVLVDLPEIAFNDQDISSIQNSIVSFYEELSGRKVNRADPEMIFFNSLAHILLLQNVSIDATAKSVLLRYASGWVLDYLGDCTDTPRLEASYATTEIRFTLSTPLVISQTIPIGTRVSPEDSDGEFFFVTTQDLDIPAGTTSGTVPAKALTPGMMSNGFGAGVVNTLIDPISFVKSVENTRETAGGADREDDESYRYRIRGANDTYSTAGPEGGYIYWAKTASSAIADVVAFSPSPCKVTVVPLLEGGIMPTPEVIAAVETALNDRTVRPITDFLTVSAPTQISYEIKLTYYIDEASAADEAIIQQAVSNAVDAYALWQRSALGRAINPSELIRQVMAAGALRVDLSGLSPSFQELEQNQFAVNTTTNITYGGLRSW
ncbi:Baseplate J-like protein [compost metagenome]